jgi:imidazoleglycerol-phosphate dehydratase
MSELVVVERETRETFVKVELRHAQGPGGVGQAAVGTSIPFLDHMLTVLSRYSGLDVSVQARGDLPHHTIEDVAIALGAALRKFLPPANARYGDRTIAMDDALVQCVIDLGERVYYRGPLPSTLYDHWMRSFAEHAKITLHLRVLRGRDRHHVVESAFKALGLALRDALAESGTVFSTKGTARWSVSC